MEENSNIRFAMKAVILKEDKILVLHKSPNEDFNPKTLDVPGGRVEFGEPIKGLLREVEEETGLSVQPVRSLNIWSILKEEENFQLIGVNFLCKWKNGELKLSEEHDSGGWVKTEKLLNKEYSEWLKEAVPSLFQK